MATPLADSVPLTGDPLKDGLLQGGSWSFTGQHELTYSLNLSPAHVTWSAAASTAVAEALQTWAAVANITFTQVTSGGQFNTSTADLAFSLANGQLVDKDNAIGLSDFPDPDIRPTLYSDLSNVFGTTYNAGNYANPEGDVFIESNYTGFAYLQPGGDGFLTILHEIGHALGLKHPHDDGLNGRPTFDQLGIGAYDDAKWTVMSYDYIDTSTFSSGNQQTPMPLDILAIQQIYGANLSYHTGDDVYFLTSGVRTIWDAGGNDTINASKMTHGVTIDLREGGFSQPDSGSFTAIAFNVAIENAVGSNYNDILIASTSGATTLAGGLGDDTYVIEDLDDTLIELAGQGIDTIKTTNSWVLSDVFENLTLTGTAALTATGNAGDNVLTSNDGNSTLDGGAGADTMIGRYDDNTYIVDNVNDVVINPGSGGTVISSVDFTLKEGTASLILTGDQDLAGIGDVVPNRITGNAGNNTLDGKFGADTLIGGAGDDVYYIDNGNDLVTELADQGHDIAFSSTHWSLSAEVDDLYLTGTADISGGGNDLANKITGNSGNNVFGAEFGGADTLIGGLGNDSYAIDLDDVVVENVGEGIDEIVIRTSYVLPANVENLSFIGSDDLVGTGNTADNSIRGSAGNDLINGLAGNDTLDGDGAGNDTLVGGLGNDVYVLHDTPVTIVESAAEGIDTVQCSSDYALGANLENLDLSLGWHVSGTGNELDNHIVGSLGDNKLVGGAGNDTLDDGEGGSDTLIGGTGDDTYIIEGFSEVLIENASEGIDTIESRYHHTLEANFEVLKLLAENTVGTGNNLDNAIYGITANETLSGLGGNDTLDGGKGADSMDGGTGDDVYVVDNVNDLVAEAVDSGNDLVSTTANFALADNVENLTQLGTAGLQATGNGVDNLITGNAGNSTLNGAGGDDTLDGGQGVDSLSGGAGDDLYLVDDLKDAIAETANEGFDQVRSSFSYVLADNLEALELTGAAANGTGNATANLLLGNAAANILDGKGGADTMQGGAGDDSYVVDSVGDKVVELAAEGKDGVSASIDYTLGANLETLTLLGSALAGTGSVLANLITGNAGANKLDGGLGADTMVGGLGDDSYVVDDANDVITELANQGIDTVQSFASYVMGAQAANVENLTLLGTGDIDGTGNAGKNLIGGNSGDNRLDGLGAADTMAGGKGDDTYVIDNAGDVITEFAGEGEDTVEALVSFTLKGNIEALVLTGAAAINGTGDAGDNMILGNAAVNSLTGNDGSDTLDGDKGADRLIGGKGDDLYEVDDAKDVITEAAGIGTGTDTVRSKAATYTLAANIENIVLLAAAVAAIGNASDNQLTGNGLANTLDGKAGADTMTGGDGDDVYYVDNLGDKVVESGSDLNDEIRSTVAIGLVAGIEHYAFTGSKAIAFLGDDAANRIAGGTGADSLGGGNGNDTLAGGAGADALAGGSGLDVYVIDNAKDVINETGGDDGDTVQSTLSVDLTLPGFNGIENVQLLGAGALFAIGDETDNQLTGNAGANKLTGNAGDDTLIGGGGNDTLTGGDGADDLQGQDGNDSYVVGLGDSVTESNSAKAGGIDLVTSDADFILGANLENLTLLGAALAGTGNELANTLTGNANANLLDGKGGIDKLIGGLGDDIYVVDDAKDTVTEGAGLNSGADTVRSSAPSYTLSANVEDLVLLAGAGSGIGNTLANHLTGNGNGNLLDGKAGADTMAGGDGNDTYIVDSIGDLVSETGTGIDTIRSAIAFAAPILNVENYVFSGSKAVLFAGDGAANAITGTALADTLSGAGGNDVLTGGAGADSLSGGDGDDRYIIANAGDKISEIGGSGHDTVESSVAFNLTENGKTVFGALEDLTLTGTGAVAGTGNDLSNLIIGNSAANALSGNAGNDTLMGGGGNDVLIGGAGDDHLDVSIGNDTVRYTGALDGHDIVDGFDGDSAGGQDVLNVDALFDSLGIAAAQRAAHVSTVDNGPSVDVFIDADGNAGNGFELLAVTLNTTSPVTIGQDIILGS